MLEKTQTLLPIPILRLPISVDKNGIKYALSDNEQKIETWKKYSEITKRLNISTNTREKAQTEINVIGESFLNFFAKEKIKLYDYTAVDDWLKKQTKKHWLEYILFKSKMSWFWNPLRASDQKIIQTLVQTLNSPWCYDHRFFIQDNTAQIKFHDNLYTKTMPFHALEKIECIEAAFKNKVSFFVSDFHTTRGKLPPFGLDPFIMAMPTTFTSHFITLKNIFIFDQWDEPGFGTE